MKIKTIIKNLEKMEDNREVIGHFFNLFCVPITKIEFNGLKINVITGKANDKAITVREAINYLNHLDSNINWQDIKKVKEFNSWAVLEINN